MLKVLILMFSCLHVSLMTVTYQHHTYPFLPACLPPLTMPFLPSVMPVLVRWALAPGHGKLQNCMAKNETRKEEKYNSLLAKVTYVSSQPPPEAIHTPNADWLAKAQSNKAHKPKHKNHPSSLQNSHALSSACVFCSVGQRTKLAKPGVWVTSLSSNIGLCAAMDHSALYSEMLPIQASMYKVLL